MMREPWISGRLARMYRAVTRQIEVTVEPNFLPERSSVDSGQYFWSYTIVITNTGEETVQLRTRHWIITDATGRKQEVRGEGVVGEQPVLGAGRALRIHLGRAAADRVGLHDRALSDGQRKRRAVRDRRADVLAGQPRQQAGVELGRCARPSQPGRAERHPGQGWLTVRTPDCAALDAGDEFQASAASASRRARQRMASPRRLGRSDQAFIFENLRRPDRRSPGLHGRKPSRPPRISHHGCGRTRSGNRTRPDGYLVEFASTRLRR